MLRWDNSQDVKKLAKVLLEGRLALCSSDTVLGLFAQLSEITKKKIDTAKNRFGKPYLVLTPSLENIKMYIEADFLAKYQDVCNSYWPAPITFIMKASDDCPAWLKGDGNTIGVRIPNHKGLQSLLQQVGPVFSTSANISGQDVPSQVEDVDQAIIEAVSAICLENLSKQPVQASTIVNLTADSPVVVRQGEIIFTSK